MGELATSLAHELNQPLNAILQNAGVAQMMLASTAVPSALAEIPTSSAIFGRTTCGRAR
jgi:C4-dicarboxylate-specific signal transduction histidine kinase